MSDEIFMKKLQVKFEFIESSNDVLNYGFYERIADYIRFIENEPILMDLFNTLGTNSFTRESFKKLIRLKEVIDSPDNVPDEWFMKKFGDMHEAIDFMFYYKSVKSLKNVLSGSIRTKAEQGFKEANYKGDVTNIHYALVELLKNGSAEGAAQQEDNMLVSQPMRAIFKVEQQGKKGVLIFKGKTYIIGKSTSRKYRLLKVLSYPTLDTPRTLESIMASIAILKDSVNKGLSSPHSRNNQMKEIIKNALGDLNKAVAEQNANFTFRAVHDKSTQSVSLQMIQYDE